MQGVWIGGPWRERLQSFRANREIALFAIVSNVIVAILLGACIVNVSGALYEHWHWPLFRTDDWDRLEQELKPAKQVLRDLPERHIEYRVEGASETYDAMSFYQLQYILTPSILQVGPTNNRYVLVQFWKTQRATALSNLTLVRDFGNGLALYAKP